LQVITGPATSKIVFQPGAKKIIRPVSKFGATSSSFNRELSIRKEKPGWGNSSVLAQSGIYIGRNDQGEPVVACDYCFLEDDEFEKWEQLNTVEAVQEVMLAICKYCATKHKL